MLRGEWSLGSTAGTVQGPFARGRLEEDSDELSGDGNHAYDSFESKIVL